VLLIAPEGLSSGNSIISGVICQVFLRSYRDYNSKKQQNFSPLFSYSSEVRVISCPAEVTMCVGLLLFIATIAVDKKRMRCEKVTTKGQVINNLNIVLFQAALDLLLHWKWGFSPAQKRNQRD